MPAKKETKPRPGEFKFKPIADWIIMDKIDILSSEDKLAKRAKLDIIGAPSPKNAMELERQKMKNYMTYAEYQEKALEVYDGLHGHQGVIKAIGPHVASDIGLSVGQKVYYRGNTGEPIIHNKHLYWAMKPHEIFGTAPKIE